MANHIKCILFDMGGTLSSSVTRTRDEKHRIMQRLIDLIGAKNSVEDFTHLLTKRANAYRRWAVETHIELTESDLWTKWMLPDWPAEQIQALAIQLNQLYREMDRQRVIFPETREVVLELFRRGYRLGLVSNTTSSVEVPTLFQELEITGCFETVILSTVVGKRKPDPSILLQATQTMGIAPEHCAFVGDRIDRDVAAARNAGFSQAILLRDPRQPIREKANGQNLSSDRTIENLCELLDLFPRRSPPKPVTVSDASLSTMWAIKTIPTLTDFFEFARRSGFARVELNHKVTSAMLDNIDLQRFQISSVHEPCPADISADELKQRDWLVSSTNEDCRREGVKAIQRSIALASQLNASAIVIHAGHTSPDHTLEKRLRALIASGKRESEECRELQQQMIKTRAGLAEASFESVKKSIRELLAYAEKSGMRLGIENRYHYMEIPNPNELEALLGLSEPARIGFIYDVGHAEVLDRMGFYAHEEWLKRFAPRIIGVHLHDVVGLTDHYAPGLGEVDFSMVARYLPQNAFRTCEFQTFNTPEEVKAGLRFLSEYGCIQSMDKTRKQNYALSH